MIPQETIDQIRDTADIVDVIGDYVQLKKRGRNFLARCPFHTEKTASFTVSPDKQMFYCFGCGKGGNAITFLMEHEKMTFVEAIRHLARKANITIQESGSGYKREKLERLNYAHTVALEYFQKTMKDSRYRAALDKYLKDRREISDDSIKQFQLGFAGDSWDGLLSYASKKDLSPQDMVDAGLAIYNENKRSYFDRFRVRLMIPIFNLSQKPIAFGGRTLKKGEPAKYVNSPETVLYSKSLVLYGLNFARDAIRASNCVYVVEGYFDVISLWQCGVQNVVASSGTSFTSQQARLLARFAETVYLFFDADSAGEQAALRSIDSLYDAGLEVRVMLSPEGEDPDTLARKGGKELIEKIRASSLDFISYRLRDVDVSGAGIIAREKLVKELAGLASRIGDPTRRSLFIDDAANRLGVDVGLLKQVQTKPANADEVAQRRQRQNKLELDFISLLFQYRGPLTSVFERVSPEDLDSKQLSRLYAAMITLYSIEGELEVNRLIENLADDELISLVGEVVMIDWPEETLTDEIRNFTAHIVKRRQNRIRTKLQQELAAAESAGDQEKADEILRQLKRYGL